ncbi:MAG: DM9 repeat-containing protein [Nostoc sp.]|uniref:DM9 repeat-containing protein n=1 Tax=Nostoc sp. TaxID=1180 RepID=UPI002FF78026
MNFSTFCIKSTLASLAIVAGTIIPASSTFAQNIPANAVFGGNDFDGTPMYVCAVIWNNGVYPGKSRLNSGTCDISYGGLEHWLPLSNSVVLTQPLKSDPNKEFDYYWQASSSQQIIPGNALPIGFENGHSLYSCRASYNGGTAIGKLTPDGLCYFGINIEIFASSYDVLAIGTVPVPDPVPVDPSCRLRPSKYTCL